MVFFGMGVGVGVGFGVGVGVGVGFGVGVGGGVGVGVGFGVGDGVGDGVGEGVGGLSALSITTLLHPSNASLATVVLTGILIYIRFLQLLNARLPIDVQAFGTIIASQAVFVIDSLSILVSQYGRCRTERVFRAGILTDLLCFENVVFEN